MIGHAELPLTEDYFREAYGQWYRHVDRWRKLQVPVAVIAALAALPLWLLHFRATSIVAVIFAVSQFVGSIHHRNQWIRRRLESTRDGESLSIEFTESGIETNTPSSSGMLAWAGIESCKLTEIGVFIQADTGESIYIPRCAVKPPEAFDHVVALAISESG